MTGQLLRALEAPNQTILDVFSYVGKKVDSLVTLHPVQQVQLLLVGGAVGMPYLTAPAQADPSQSSAAAGTVGSFGWLRALLEGCGLVAKLDSAITWCDGQDVDSLAMLKEIEMEDELVKQLGLKPGKQKQLRMRIKNAEA